MVMVNEGIVDEKSAFKEKLEERLRIRKIGLPLKTEQWAIEGTKKKKRRINHCH